MKEFNIKKLTSQRLFLPIFCLALVLFVNVMTTPDFFAISVRDGVLYGYIIDIINRASELVILAIGMTLVVSASAGTDISVGAIMAVSAAVCCNLLTGGERAATEYACPLILGFLAALVIGALIGCFNGVLVAKLKIQPMVATLIMFTAGRGIAQLITDGQITYVRVESYKVLGSFLPHVPVPTPFIVAMLMVIVTSLILKKTALGLYIQSVGINVTMFASRTSQPSNVSPINSCAVKLFKSSIFNAIIRKSPCFAVSVSAFAVSVLLIQCFCFCFCCFCFTDPVFLFLFCCFCFADPVFLFCCLVSVLRIFLLAHRFLVPLKEVRRGAVRTIT